MHQVSALPAHETDTYVQSTVVDHAASTQNVPLCFYRLCHSLSFFVTAYHSFVPSVGATPPPMQDLVGFADILARKNLTRVLAQRQALR
eukprot:m.83723 g.83723  ORF g.83723 m.83723 type:complete len:89 (+) comp14659_c0_seq2:1642-1908(+)